MLQPAVNPKDYEAVVPLGDYHCDGPCTELKHHEPVESCKRAADKHVVLAHLLIRDCGLEGINVNGESELAHRWYKTAAEYGEPQPFMELGNCCTRGLGVITNEPLCFLHTGPALTRIFTVR